MPPPRYLLRRGVAFALDHTLALIVIALACLPFVDTLGLRLPTPLLHLRTVDCTPLNAPPDWLAAEIGTAQIATLRLCQSHLYGLPNGHEVIAVFSEDRPAGAAPGQRLTRLRRVPVDAALRPLALPDLSALAVVVLMGLASALLTRAGLPSPGKALMRLRVVGTPGHPFAREALRLGPLALVVAPPLLVPVPLVLWPFGAVVGTVAGVVLAAVWLYIWPLVVWSGQTRYDRLAGFRVVIRP